MIDGVDERRGAREDISGRVVASFRVAFHSLRALERPEPCNHVL